MLVEESKVMDFKSAIRLWVTQTHTIDKNQIQVAYPLSINSSGFFQVSTSKPSASHHPTTPSVSTTELLGSQDSKWDDSCTESGSGGLLAIETRSSPLQMTAQDITISVSKIANILELLKEAAPRQIQIAIMNPLKNSLNRPYLGLTNTHVQSIVDKLVAAGIGSREDSLMSITSALLQRSRLPHLDEVMEELLSYAKSHQTGQ